MESEVKTKWLLILLLIVIAIITTRMCNTTQPDITSIKYDTLTVYDTIVQAIAKDSVVKKYEIVKLTVIDDSARIDTIYKTDSVKVEVPITQKTYSDSTYKAVISGFHVSLDSMFVKNKTITKTITETRYKPTKWGLGVSAGYDPINNKWGVMLGVQYNILPIK